MAYFAGPNVTVLISRAEPLTDSNVPKRLEECAGVSYVLNNSQQPIYGYASTNFDAMLPGREVVQGTLLLNHRGPKPFYDVLNSSESREPTRGQISYNGLLNEPIDIHIQFGNNHHTIIINYCYIFSRGETVQVSDQGIIEEYSFIGRSLSYREGR
jgi:hypothetical protein